MDFDLRSRTILLTVAGSRAYGIHRPGSDVDLKGVAVPTEPYFHGFARKFEQADKSAEMAPFADLLSAEEAAAVAATKLEGTVYDVRKFLTLAADNNPNILDVLFCRDEEVRLATPVGRLLRENRDLFLSAKAKHTFSGYASAQLKRIKGHRKWLLEPPDHVPTRAEFGLPEHTLIPADQLAAANAAVRKKIDGWELDLSGLSDAEIIHVHDQVAHHLAEIRVALGFESEADAKWLAAARLVGLDANLIYVMQKEREYEAAARHFKQYEEWRERRNPERAALEARHGYDTKHAGHLVRLLRMGREILTTGRVNVWRGPSSDGPADGEEIRAIRDGQWSYEALVAWAEGEDAELEAIWRERRYVVPKTPDREAIDALCVRVVREMLG
jgi:uncharacterized protein